MEINVLVGKTFWPKRASRSRPLILVDKHNWNLEESLEPLCVEYFSKSVFLI